jgi:hypothetical protein
MTTFRWVDRHGVVHNLTDHESIERERQQVRQELLDLRAALDSADDAIFIVAHNEATVLRARMVALQADLQGFVRHEAVRATAVIDRIELEASFIRSLHRSYEQFADHSGNDTTTATSPTAEQISVLKRQAIRDDREVSIPATFGDAHSLILAHPATCRTPLPDTAPAFEWTDRNMHYHQVRDLGQIEREYVALAGELTALLPQLAADVPIQGVLAALERGRLAVDRVIILEGAMKRWTSHVIGVVRAEYVTFLDDLEKFDGRNV